MCECVYICLHCVRLYAFKCMCDLTYACMVVPVCMFVGWDAWIRVCSCMHACVIVCVLMYMHMHTYECSCVRVCVYIHGPMCVCGISYVVGACACMCVYASVYVCV